MVPVDAFDFADFCHVDVEVGDVLRVRREPGWIASDPVIEPGTDRDQEITILDGVIRECHAVHAEHMQ
jgi:hypothetical protein